MTTSSSTTKNAALIGSSLLGSWSSEVTLSSDDNSSVTAYMMVHFMADPRKALGCNLANCREVDNHVCMITATATTAMDEDTNGHLQKSCHDMGQEINVSWSDLTVFYYFGVKIASTSEPVANLEFNTGDWIGPFNLIMAQKDITNTNSSSSSSSIVVNGTILDQYVARHVQSQSMIPPLLQNRLPPSCTLYTKPDLYASFLGNSALNHTTQLQTNRSIHQDPYQIYRETCTYGNLQPLLPHVELTLVRPNDISNNTNSNYTLALVTFQYKIMAAPTPDEQAYRVLPLLQSKFQGNGGYNIIGGPYCYGDDPRRAFSFDLNFTSISLAPGTTHSYQEAQLQSDLGHASTFVRGCIDGYPCVPPAAMGGIPTIIANQTCPPMPPRPDPNPHATGISNMVLGFVCYGLTVTLLIFITLHFQGSRNKKQRSRDHKDDDDFMAALLARSARHDDVVVVASAGDDHDCNQPVYFGAMDLMEGVGITAGSDNHHTNETSIGPFGDLDGESSGAVDPLQEPLLLEGDRVYHETQEASEAALL